MIEFTSALLSKMWPSSRRLQWAALGALVSLIAPLLEWLIFNFIVPLTQPFPLSAYIYTEAVSLVTFSVFGYWLGKYAEAIEILATRDELTGLYNRRSIDAVVSNLVAINLRYGRSFSIFLLDLDHFKRVNDRYGHPTGDNALRAVARCIEQTIRDTDIAGRYGGEEFIVACPNTSSTDANQLAERIRIAVASIPGSMLGFPGPQTVSIGLASIPAKCKYSMQELIALTDQALYKAKDQGRNQVVETTIKNSF